MTEATYDSIGRHYSRFRVPDPRIATAINDALGNAATVINVGAGTGSYEPPGYVLAIEPSMTMIRQRPDGSAPAIQAAAEALPVATRAFDAALAVLTIHHWTDWRAGLQELRRVARRCVVFTFDPPRHNQLWLLRDYLPAALATPAVTQAPTVDEIAKFLRTDRIEPVLIPHDCADGFGWAYWRRPEHYLDPAAAQSTSVLAQTPDSELRAGLDQLAEDLSTGRWHRRYQHLLDSDAVDGGFRLIISDTSPDDAP